LNNFSGPSPPGSIKQNSALPKIERIEELEDNESGSGSFRITTGSKRPGRDKVSEENSDDISYNSEVFNSPTNAGENNTIYSKHEIDNIRAK